MLDLAALAAMRDGDRTYAIARWTEVARTRPLSWAALVARARLTEAGAALPPPIDPPEPGQVAPPLAQSLPPPADTLHRVGLDADAENALREREGTLTAGTGGPHTQGPCPAHWPPGGPRRTPPIP